MRVFAVSDIHIDYDVNLKWIANLSAADYQDDVLILAGDVSDTRRLFAWCLATLVKRFRKVLFVPGNHDLWVIREPKEMDSLQKLDQVRAKVIASGASMEPLCERGVTIIPLLSWYDYSFGEPSLEVRSIWMDYHACRWPSGYQEKEIAAHFESLNERSARWLGRTVVTDSAVATDSTAITDNTIITFSHFLPRIDLMPGFMPRQGKLLYPVLGTWRIDEQLRRLGSRAHVYGHSHVRRHLTIDGVSYLNNALGYPSETWNRSKTLKCIHQC